MEKTLARRLVNVIRLSVLANWHLLKLGSYLSLEEWGAEALSFLKIISKREETGRRLLKEAEKESTLASFLIEMA